MPKKIEFDSKQLNKLHYVVATAIVIKDGKYLIIQRAAWEKAFPNEWTFPGGKLEMSDYTKLPTSTKHKMWYNISETLLNREVMEEVGLKIKNIRYICDLVFIRPDGIPVVTLSYAADWASGKVRLTDENPNYVWVTLKEAKKYPLIDGMWEELLMLDKMLNGKKVTKWKKKK